MSTFDSVPPCGREFASLRSKGVNTPKSKVWAVCGDAHPYYGTILCHFCRGEETEKRRIISYLREQGGANSNFYADAIDNNEHRYMRGHLIAGVKDE